jgi:hypothetical protein
MSCPAIPRDQVITSRRSLPPKGMVTEPFFILRLAGLKNMDGFGQLASPPGAAAELAHDEKRSVCKNVQGMEPSLSHAVTLVSQLLTMLESGGTMPWTCRAWRSEWRRCDEREQSSCGIHAQR